MPEINRFDNAIVASNAVNPRALVHAWFEAMCEIAEEQPDRPVYLALADCAVGLIYYTWLDLVRYALTETEHVRNAQAFLTESDTYVLSDWIDAYKRCEVLSTRYTLDARGHAALK